MSSRRKSRAAIKLALIGLAMARVELAEKVVDLVRQVVSIWVGH